MERLQKIISQAGLASRRAAETWIAEGRVTVDGQVITAPGTKADPAVNEIRVDGQPLPIAEKHVYYLLNKPMGYISTVHDEHGRRTVRQILSAVKERIYPIGRLDYDTEGLLLFTNDGDLMNALLHPSHEIFKTYEAAISGQLAPEDVRRLQTGVSLSDGLTAPAEARILAAGSKGSRVQLTIHEGRNRQVRRMFEAVGHEVHSLERIAFAGLDLSGVLRGEYRPLTRSEVSYLRSLAGK